MAVLWLLPSGAAWAGQPEAAQAQTSITDSRIAWPSATQWRRVFFLRDYNTRVVVLGTTLLGCAAGMVGSFTLLRKRALMGDALSHATLPGIALAFIIATLLGANGKSLPILLLGATVSGLIGVGAILAIRNLTRLKEDAALGIVMSVFFGAGVALLRISQEVPGGYAAGLESFITGKTASMLARDAQLIGAAALVCIGVCLLLFKELRLLCFDDGFAGSRGLPVLGLDLALMALVVIVTIVGLQAVGLILMVAMLVTPPAAARFWTDNMRTMAILSSLLGAAGGLLGSAMSGLFPRLPSGAMIVLVCALFFALSMIFGTARGLLVRWVRRFRLNRAMDRQHLLRALYELTEVAADEQSVAPAEGLAISMRDLLAKRSWTWDRLARTIRRAEKAHLVSRQGDSVFLPPRGLREAARLTRQHRLWELYLITHADIAPSKVDRDADAIEHVLEPDVIRELEALLAREYPGVPASPHALETGGGPTLAKG